MPITDSVLDRDVHPISAGYETFLGIFTCLSGLRRTLRSGMLWMVFRTGVSLTEPVSRVKRNKRPGGNDTCYTIVHHRALTPSRQ